MLRILCYFMAVTVLLPCALSQSDTSTIPTVKVTELDATKTKKAVYPLQAAQQQIQGEVRLRLILSEKGSVEHAEVLSGDPILADAALEAAKKWVFKPYMLDGTPRKVATELSFDFYFRGKAKDVKPEDQAATVPLAVQQVSSGTAQGLLLHSVSPVYPPDARKHRIEGTVILEVVIGKDGRVSSLTPVSGPKELIGAAVGAVQQWRYRPFVMNGEPVAVRTRITVNFILH